MSRKINRATGTYYRNKTALWLRSRGYRTEVLERSVPKWIKDKETGKPRMILCREDVLGADLVAWSKDELLLVQAKKSTHNIAAAVTLFVLFGLPDCVSKIVVCWEPRAKKPRLAEVVGNGYEWKEVL